MQKTARDDANNLNFRVKTTKPSVSKHLHLSVSSLCRLVLIRVYSREFVGSVQGAMR